MHFFVFLGLFTSQTSDADLVPFATSPADIVTLRSGEKLTVQPLTRPPGNEPVTLMPIDSTNKPRRVASDDIADVDYFENRYLKHLSALPNSAAKLESLERLHTRMRQTHYARRDVAPLQPSPWQTMEAALEDKSDEIRRALLNAILDGAPTDAEWRKADAFVTDWLAGARAESVLRPEARRYLVRRALAQCQKDEYPAAKNTLERFERAFPNHADADDVRAKLHAHVTALLQQASSATPVAARKLLLEAKTLWPGAPGLEEAWRRIEPKVRVLRIASARVPTALTPDAAVTPEDHVALDLLYDRLPNLLEALPAPDTHLDLKLRRDISWSNGERLTAEDVRHTVRQRLKSHAGKGLAEALEPPRGESAPFDMTLSLRRGLVDPLRVLQLPVVPRHAKTEAYSGAFMPAAKPSANEMRLRANPYSHRQGLPFDEIHWTRWAGVPADDPPQLLWDAPANERDALTKAGYRDWRVLTPPRVWYIALNVQRPALSNVDLRRALAHAIPREKLLDQHFRMGQAMHAPVNGPFVLGSWAQAAPSRVPASLDQPALAASFAKKAAAEVKSVELTLIGMKGDPHWQSAITDMAKHMEDALKSAGINARIVPKMLDPLDYRQALEKGDFDMAITWVDRAEDILPLVDLTGGDPRLQELISQMLRHRQVAVLREQMHDFHAALIERMPIIPLWQLQIPIAIHTGTTIHPLDPLHPFAK